MSISKVNVSSTDHQIVGSPRYATCSTAAATAAKVAAIADGSSTFTLEKGARICVKFIYANTVATPTLNVGSTGAKAIYWHGAALASSQYWQANAVIDFVYNGTQWELVGVAKDNNSTNYLPLSGGTLTGNLTGQYLTGTWLQTTAVTDKAGDFATIDSDGWIYKRTAEEVRSDIGAQAAGSYAAASHNHSASNITSGTLAVARGGTGQTSVDSTPTSGSKKMCTSGGIYTALAGKAASSHTHDDRYYTESEVNTLVNARVKVSSWDGTNLYLTTG